MPLNKNALLRFRVIDACLTSRQLRYPTMEAILQKIEAQLGQGISASQFAKDLQQMKSIYGAPVRYNRFHKGYYYEQEGFSIRAFPLTNGEIEALDYSTALLYQLRGTRMFEQFENAINKVIEGYRVSRYLGKSEKQILQVEEPIRTEGQAWLEVILKAIVEKKGLRIRYAPYGRPEKEHPFSPYLLKEYHNRWYTVGHAKKQGQPITLALDRIQEIHEDGDYVYDESFYPADFFRYSIGITQVHGARPERVCLTVSRAAAPYFLSQPIHHSQRVVGEAEGSVRLELQVYITTELKMTILSHGSEVEVTAPQSLREGLQATIGAMAQCYAKEKV